MPSQNPFLNFGTLWGEAIECSGSNPKLVLARITLFLPPWHGSYLERHSLCYAFQNQTEEHACSI